MANITCESNSCDHNTGFTHSCSFSINSDLIKAIKRGDDVCPLLKAEVLNILEEVRKSET